jgi:Ca2+-binding EF-hand superfamily protein/CRP-like cAMP-binding protein
MSPRASCVVESGRGKDENNENGSSGSEESSSSAQGMNEYCIPWRRPALATGETEPEQYQIQTCQSDMQTKGTAEELMKILGGLALLGPLLSVDSDQLLEVLDFVVYEQGESIVQQGSRCMDGMYIFLHGVARAEKTSLVDSSVKILRKFEARAHLDKEVDETLEDHGDKDGSDDEESQWGNWEQPEPVETTNRRRYEAMDYFGEFALWKRQPVSHSVVCDTECRIVKIQRDMLVRLGVFEDVLQQLHVVGTCLHDSRLRQQFEFFDADQDGLLTLHESWSIFRALGCGYTFAEFEQGFARIGSAWVDALSYEDFFAFWDTCSLIDPLMVRTEHVPNVETNSEDSVDGEIEVDSFEWSAQGAFPNQNSIAASTPDICTIRAKWARNRIGSMRTVVVTGESNKELRNSEAIDEMLALMRSFADMGAIANIKKLEILESLKRLIYSLPAQMAGSASIAILKDQKFFKTLVHTVGDKNEDKHVRRTAAGILEACLETSETACAILFNREATSNMSCNTERDAWRAALMATVANKDGCSPFCPSLSRLLDTEQAVPVFSAFDNLGAHQPDAKDFRYDAKVRNDSIFGSVHELEADRKRLKDEQERIEMDLKRAEARRMWLKARGLLTERRATLSKSPSLSAEAKGGEKKHELARVEVSNKYIWSIPPPDLEAEFAEKCGKFHDFLASVPLFQNLDADQRKKLSYMSEINIYNENDIICAKGARGRTHFFILYKGSAVTTDPHVPEKKGETHSTAGAANTKPENARNSGQSRALEGTLSSLSSQNGQNCDALSGEAGRRIHPREVFGLESVAAVHHNHSVVTERLTCSASSKICMVFQVPYDDYELLTQRCTRGLVMNNLADRKAKLESAFHRLDIDQNGFLDQNEIGRLCNYVGIKCDALKLCGDIGTNNLVTHPQFSRWWEDLNVYDIEHDAAENKKQEDAERARIMLLLGKARSVRDQEWLLSRPPPPPPTVKYFYDMQGRRQVISENDRNKQNSDLVQVRESNLIRPGEFPNKTHGIAEDPNLKHKKKGI